MAVLPVNLDIEFGFELLNNATGAVVSVPQSTVLYVVQPGSQTPVAVVGASFQAVSAGSFRTRIPAAYVQTPGLLSAFVLAQGAASRTVHVFQVGENPPANTDLWVPFVARRSTGDGILTLGPGDVLLSVALGTFAATRSLATAEFSALLGNGSTATPFYAAKIRASEIGSSGILTYSLTGTGLSTFSADIGVGDPDMFSVRFQLSPTYPEPVVVEIFRKSDGILAARVTTNVTSQVDVLLRRAQYTYRLSYLNWVFTQNNGEFTVDETINGFVQLDARHTIPAQNPVGFTRVVFRLLNPDGSPVAGRKLLFAPKLAVLSGNSAGVVKNTMAVTTDSDGRGSINLIAGLVVVVTLEGTRLYEEFTVPDTVEVNLFSLISFADRGFDAYLADLDYGLPRTLSP